MDLRVNNHGCMIPTRRDLDDLPGFPVAAIRYGIDSPKSVVIPQGEAVWGLPIGPYINALYDLQKWHPKVIELCVVCLESHDLDWSPLVLVIPVSQLTWPREREAQRGWSEAFYCLDTL